MCVYIHVNTIQHLEQPSDRCHIFDALQQNSSVAHVAKYYIHLFVELGRAVAIIVTAAMIELYNLSKKFN